MASAYRTGAALVNSAGSRTPRSSTSAATGSVTATTRCSTAPASRASTMRRSLHRLRQRRPTGTAAAPVGGRPRLPAPGHHLHRLRRATKAPSGSSRTTCCRASSPRAEWDAIERGLTQRITALNLFLHDIYHDGTHPRRRRRAARAGLQLQALPPRDARRAGAAATSTSPSAAPTWSACRTASSSCSKTTCACRAACATCSPTAR